MNISKSPVLILLFIHAGAASADGLGGLSAIPVLLGIVSITFLLFFVLPLFLLFIVSQKNKKSPVSKRASLFYVLPSGLVGLIGLIGIVFPPYFMGKLISAPIAGLFLYAAFTVYKKCEANRECT